LQKLIKYIGKNILVKVTRLNSVSILTKIFAGVITSKAIAIFVGVEGMALIGNLKNFFSALQSIAILGFYKGLVKYIAEFKNNALQLSRTLSTGYYLGFCSTILLALLCFYNAEAINNFLFSSNYNYTYIIKILSFALPFYSLNVFSFSIINGFSKYKILMIINIIGQILGLFVTLLLIYQNKINGALVAIVIAPSLMFLMTLVAIINRKSLAPQIRLSNITFKMLKRFAPFTMMALITAVGLPIIYIIIRNYIIESIGIKYAGYWESMNRISEYYLIFVTSMMTLYIIPKFNELKTKKEFKAEILATYKLIIPILGLGMLMIYLLRPYIVRIIFTEAFLPVKDLFLWQLLGDFVKVLSIVIAYQFIAKRMFAHFIVIELFLVVMIYFSSVYLVDVFGIQGAVMAHFISYVMYFGIVLLIFGSSIFKLIPSDVED